MKKNYVRIDLIKRAPESCLSQQEKTARLYELAEKLKVKIGAENVKKGK